MDMEAIFHLLKPRLQRLNDVFTAGKYFFEEVDYNAGEIKSKWKPEASIFLSKLIDGDNASVFNDPEKATELVMTSMNEAGLKMGNAMPVLRAALTGSIQGADVYQVAKILGSEKVKARISHFINWAKENV